MTDAEAREFLYGDHDVSKLKLPRYMRNDLVVELDGPLEWTKIVLRRTDTHLVWLAYNAGHQTPFGVWKHGTSERLMARYGGSNLSFYAGQDNWVMARNIMQRSSGDVTDTEAMCYLYCKAVVPAGMSARDVASGKAAKSVMEIHETLRLDPFWKGLLDDLWGLWITSGIMSL